MNRAKKFYYLILGIVIGIFFTYSIISNGLVGLPNNKIISKLENKNIKVINENKGSSTFTVSTLKANNNIYLSVSELKEIFNIDIEDNSGFIQIGNEEARLGRINSEQLLVEVKSNKGLTMDGNPLNIETYENFLLLEHKKKLYVSIDFIKDYYRYDKYYGLVAKGFPVENYLINTSGLIDFRDFNKLYYNRYGKEYKGDFLQPVKLELNGVTLSYGEPGFTEYVITKNTFMTERGITIGSTREEVQHQYGKLGESNEEIWRTFTGNAEFSEGNKLIFTFKDDIVVQIKYGW